MSPPRSTKPPSASTAASTAARASGKKSPRQRAPLTITLPQLLVDGSDAEFRRLVHNIFAFASRHEAMRAGHGAVIGLTGIEYTFLISVRHLEDAGDIGVTQLAEHLHLSGPFTTTMVGKLIKRGLLVKETDPADRRRVCLHVTPAGHNLLAGLAPTQRKVNDIQFGCLSKQDFQLLLSLLDKLIDSSEQALSLQAYLLKEQALKA